MAYLVNVASVYHVIVVIIAINSYALLVPKGFDQGLNVVKK